MKDKIIIAGLLFMSSFFMTAQEKQQVKALPKEGTEFIQTYFKDQKIKSIYRTKSENSSKYEAILENGTEIEFTGRGRWTEVEGNSNSVPTGFLKAETVAYLKANYAGQKINEIKNGERFVFVELANGLKLQFEKEGKFARIYED